MRTLRHSLPASSHCHQRSWYLLGDFSARQSLRTADSRKRIAELLRGEDALAGLLHGQRVLLASRALGLLDNHETARSDPLLPRISNIGRLVLRWINIDLNHSTLLGMADLY